MIYDRIMKWLRTAKTKRRLVAMTEGLLLGEVVVFGTSSILELLGYMTMHSMVIMNLMMCLALACLVVTITVATFQVNRIKYPNPHKDPTEVRDG